MVNVTKHIVTLVPTDLMAKVFPIREDKVTKKLLCQIEHADMEAAILTVFHVSFRVIITMGKQLRREVQLESAKLTVGEFSGVMFP